MNPKVLLVESVTRSKVEVLQQVDKYSSFGRPLMPFRMTQNLNRAAIGSYSAARSQLMTVVSEMFCSSPHLLGWRKLLPGQSAKITTADPKPLPALAQRCEVRSKMSPGMAQTVASEQSSEASCRLFAQDYAGGLRPLGVKVDPLDADFRIIFNEREISPFEIVSCEGLIGGAVVQKISLPKIAPLECLNQIKLPVDRRAVLKFGGVTLLSDNVCCLFDIDGNRLASSPQSSYDKCKEFSVDYDKTRLPGEIPSLSVEHVFFGVLRVK